MEKEGGGGRDFHFLSSGKKKRSEIDCTDSATTKKKVERFFLFPDRTFPLSRRLKILDAPSSTVQ